MEIMSDETTEPQQEAPQGEPAPKPATDTAPAPGTEQDPPADANAEPKQDESEPKRTPWFQRRIDELTHQRWEATRRAEALEAELARQRQSQPQPDQQKPDAHSPQDIEQLAMLRARQIAADNEFNAQCMKTYETGKAAYPDFDEAVRGLGMLTGGQVPRDFLDAVTALPNGQDVYYKLGKDLDEAARVLRLPPARMAIEMAKLSGNVGRKPVSAAPPPIKPVDARSRSSDEPLDDDPIDVWMAKRNKQLMNRRA
jgi:hypothetical protein